MKIMTGAILNCFCSALLNVLIQVAFWLPLVGPKIVLQSLFSRLLSLLSVVMVVVRASQTYMRGMVYCSRNVSSTFFFLSILS